MTMDELYFAIGQVCPIIEAFVGDPDDRNTWQFTPAKGATPEQIEEAKRIINPDIQPMPIVLSRSMP